MRRGSLTEIIERGMGQFVWRFGVVWFGGIYFCTSALLRYLASNPDYRHDPKLVVSLIVISFVYALSVGAVFGLIGWFAIRMFAASKSLRHEAPSGKALVAAANK